MIRSTIRALTCLFVLSALWPAVLGAEGAQRPSPGTLLWDTQSPLVNKADIEDRTGWTVVNGSRLENEEYVFAGDAVAENQHITAVFSSRRGSVSIYSGADLSRMKVQFVPLELKGRSASITNCTVLRNTDDKVILEVSFCGGAREDNCSAVFSFGSSETIAIEPAANMKGISLLSPIEYGVVPSFIADDLIFDVGQYPSMDTLHVPCENLFLGLLKGRDDMLVATWPEGKQRMRLILDDAAENRLVESVDLDNDGKSIFLALLHAPGIWHKEELKPSYLEKDVAIGWKRPFPGKWTTQLLEAGVKTTFRFRESKQEIWRAVIGYYTYPVWFEGQRAHYRLGKKIPPGGISLIYCLERKGASGSPASAVDILEQTLDKDTYDRKLALQSRANLDLVRPDSRIDPDDMSRHAARGSCPVSTCAVTRRLGSVFEAGQERQRRKYVEAGIEDMMYFVVRHRNRIDQYMDFAREMTEFLEKQGKDKPALKPFISKMQTIAQEIPREYDRLKDAIKDLEYAAGLARQSTALTQEKRPKNPGLFSELGEKWRSMGGAQDDLVREFHTTTRKLFQEAGYGCVGLPGAVEMAEEIRRRCAACLSNPSTYEIWPDY
ncbi:MAG: hypothetical protein JSW66_14140 [Phycisphaerales bacterium]|nr:MAG: hypothetical protein JSW66_14140 [Phycisphaerales bacterium]